MGRVTGAPNRSVRRPIAVSFGGLLTVLVAAALALVGTPTLVEITPAAAETATESHVTGSEPAIRRGAAPSPAKAVPAEPGPRDEADGTAGFRPSDPTHPPPPLAAHRLPSRRGPPPAAI